MGNTDSDTDGAAARLHQLQQYYREHPVTGPAEGHCTSAHSGAPLSLATLDHVAASVREMAEHTYAVNPDAGPIPEPAAAVYDWCHEHTEHAPEAARSRGEAIEYRQYLEHCLAQRDNETVRKAVRTLPCPRCGCWGLMWMTERRLAVCTNMDCTDRDGFSTTLTLAQIARARGMARQNVRQARAT